MDSRDERRRRTRGSSDYPTSTTTTVVLWSVWTMRTPYTETGPRWRSVGRSNGQTPTKPISSDGDVGSRRGSTIRLRPNPTQDLPEPSETRTFPPVPEVLSFLEGRVSDTERDQPLGFCFFFYRPTMDTYPIRTLWTKWRKGLEKPH